MIRSRALSNATAVFILIVLTLLIFVPVLFYLYAVHQQNVVSSSIYDNYVYLKNLQLNQVDTGHPSLYYIGPTIFILYSTNGILVPPLNFTIVGILYLNPSTGVWCNITTFVYPIALKYPIVISNKVISQGQPLPIDKHILLVCFIVLPPYVQGDPIIIVTSLGNLFFLTPGSSIGPFPT